MKAREWGAAVADAIAAVRDPEAVANLLAVLRHCPNFVLVADAAWLAKHCNSDNCYLSLSKADARKREKEIRRACWLRWFGRDLVPVQIDRPDVGDALPFEEVSEEG